MTSRQVYDRSLSRKFFENQKFQMTPKLPSENCTYYTLFQKSIFRRTKIIFPILSEISITFLVRLEIVNFKKPFEVLCIGNRSKNVRKWISVLNYLYFLLLFCADREYTKEVLKFFFLRQNRIF